MAEEENISIDIEMIKITEKAYFVSTQDKTGKKIETWIPKSQAIETDCLAAGDQGYLIIKPWFAVKANLIEKKEK